MSSRARRNLAIAQGVQSIIKPLDPVVGCEIGVWEGGTSEYLLTHFPFMSLYMIDSWQVETVQMNVNDQAVVDTAKQMAINRTRFAFARRSIIHKTSIEAAKLFSDGGLCFVFIDADHRYEAVRDDLNAWWPKVRKGGILLGDNYNDRRETNGPSIRRWGVKRAVDEFAEENGWAFDTYPTKLWSIQK